MSKTSLEFCEGVSQVDCVVYCQKDKNVSLRVINSNIKHLKEESIDYDRMDNFL